VAGSIIAESGRIITCFDRYGRQSGKTTLVRDLLRGTHIYINLEDPDVKLRAIEDPRGFLDQLSTPVVLETFLLFSMHCVSLQRARKSLERRVGSCAFISRSPESFRLGGDILVYPWQEVLGI
jgi:hypothetical protein